MAIDSQNPVLAPATLYDKWQIWQCNVDGSETIGGKVVVTVRFRRYRELKDAAGNVIVDANGAAKKEFHPTERIREMRIDDLWAACAQDAELMAVVIPALNKLAAMAKAKNIID